MKRFHCQCGAQLFFENQHCLKCGLDVGFDSELMTMVPVDGQDVVYCGNWHDCGVCNWIRPRQGGHHLCVACQFNRTIPDLTLPNNLQYWGALEQAKKRLLFTLMTLGLPLQSGWCDPNGGLLFDFLDDERSKPEHYAGNFVTSGFGNGVITLNVLEADDAARAAMQSEMLEPYRTLLGHFRHESGHYYWSLMSHEAAISDAFADLLGDPNKDYAGSLERYYETGPPSDWQDGYISAYATAHPLEDWAETWGHYLHMLDALETARAHHLLEKDGTTMSMSERIAAWQQVSVMLNEMNRSVGGSDAYPFTISTGVARKLELVDGAMGYLQRRQTD